MHTASTRNSPAGGPVTRRTAPFPDADPHPSSTLHLVSAPRRTAVALLLVTLLALLTGCGDAADAALPVLSADQRVYDTTGDSLDPTATRALAARIDAVDRETGADTVVVVRELDASSDDTLEQVEALQLAWIAATGASQEKAVAILVNRDPADRTEARAGIFVGTRFDDGAVDTGRQRLIVSEALIPPLRDGDVARSLTAALDRFAADVRSGPSVHPLAGVARVLGARTWLPWVLLAVSLAGLGAVARLWGCRPRASGPEAERTTRRPDDLSPAVGAALVAQRAQPDVVPALVLALAARGTIELEPVRRGGEVVDDELTVRLHDAPAPRDELETIVHRMLTTRAKRGRVNSKKLKEVVRQTTTVTDAVEAELRARGWKDDVVPLPRQGLSLIGWSAVFLDAGALGLLDTGATLMAVGIGGLTVLLVAAFTAARAYPRLTPAGLDAARPWTAYRDGLEAAAKDETADLDLDAALPDLVALDLGEKFSARLTAASRDGTALRAFSGADPASAMASWTAFNTVWVSASSSDGGSSGGGSSGGGAAGST